MWLLPLSSGFAAGCFVGSLKASGPIGQLAVTATGGFAVWLLSYFLLPRPQNAAPPSVSTELPKDMSFRGAAKFLAELDGYDAAFSKFDNAVLDEKVQPGRITAGTVLELIKRLRHRLINQTVQIDYDVERDQNAGLFRITKI